MNNAPTTRIAERTATFRILAADRIAQEGLDFIASQPDTEVLSRTGLSEQELADTIGDFDGLIVRSGAKITARVLERPGRLKVIARAGVGTDNIDLDAATAAGILVLNTAEASTITTAEHTFALLLALARHVGPAYASMREGAWQHSGFDGRQLAGKTLGIVGFGRIGRTIAVRALAFDMNVIAFDPFINAATTMEGRVRMSDRFEDLLPHADILTFHVPLNDQTRALLDRRTLSLCREGVMVVNASRGGVVDEGTLLEGLQTGKVGGAALDVFETEPLPSDSPLRSHDRVLLTPHLGASTLEAQQAVSTDAAAAVLEYLRGKQVRGAVNATGLRLDLDPTQACFADLANRMARLLDPMMGGRIRAVTLHIASPQLTAVAATLERICLVGLLQSHLDVPLNLVNAGHVAKQRGIEQRTVTAEHDPSTGAQLVLEVSADGRGEGKPHRIEGRVYDDMRPRVVQINGYHMDMIPAGFMVLILNDDRPGMVGLVGTQFGEARINIADMAISRRDHTALMVLKIDEPPGDELLDRLRTCPGIRKVALVKLPKE
jgi:D-3-phosphoglycerate dehydrogenase